MPPIRTIKDQLSIFTIYHPIIWNVTTILRVHTWWNVVIIITTYHAKYVLLHHFSYQFLQLRNTFREKRKGILPFSNFIKHNNGRTKKAGTCPSMLCKIDPAKLFFSRRKRNNNLQMRTFKKRRHFSFRPNFEISSAEKRNVFGKTFSSEFWGFFWLAGILYACAEQTLCSDNTV